MAKTCLPHGNNHGISLFGGDGQLCKYVSVLGNPHGISLGSGVSYPIEEGTHSIDIHPGLLAVCNKITSSGIILSGII